MANGVITPVENAFTVYAQTDRSGFFGLTELEAFSTVVEPYVNASPPTTLIMDFSAVRVWDIAALLWMVVGLDHFRRDTGLLFRLRLPQSRPNMTVSETDSFDRCADYLRRWRLDRALENIDSDVASLLVPDQRNYFSPPEPRRFYSASTVTDDANLLHSLMSRRLTEIRSLSDPSFTGSAPIPASNVFKCIREFQAERIGDIFAAQCGIDKRTSDLFADHLLTEALLNVQEHPNATIALLSISLMGGSRELVLSIVDNGDSIPSTIYPRYSADFVGTVPPGEYSRVEMDFAKIGKIADHATKPGVTRKAGASGEKVGMGLTYIKEDTLNLFHGKLTIVTDGVKITYSSDAPLNEPSISPWSHRWRGNLIRIAIPIQKKSVSPISDSRFGTSG